LGGGADGGHVDVKTCEDEDVFDDRGAAGGSEVAEEDGAAVDMDPSLAREAA
jgi:hypothetical protein